jgi:hypothetical protein
MRYRSDPDPTKPDKIPTRSQSHPDPIWLNMIRSDNDQIAIKSNPIQIQIRSDLIQIRYWSDQITSDQSRSRFKMIRWRPDTDQKRSDTIWSDRDPSPIRSIRSISESNQIWLDPYPTRIKSDPTDQIRLIADPDPIRSKSDQQIRADHIK